MRRTTLPTALLLAFAALVAARAPATAGVVRIHAGTTSPSALAPDVSGRAAAAGDGFVDGGDAGGALPLRIPSSFEPAPLPAHLELWSSEAVTPSRDDLERLYRRLWLEVDAVPGAAPGPADRTEPAREPRAWLEREFALVDGLGVDPATPRLGASTDGRDDAPMRVEAIPNPEPATWALFALGALALGLASRRRQRVSG